MKKTAFFITALLCLLLVPQAAGAQVTKRTATFTGYNARTLTSKEKEVTFVTNRQPDGVDSNGCIIFNPSNDPKAATATLTTKERFSGLVTVQLVLYGKDAEAYSVYGFVTNDDTTSRDVENISTPDDLEQLSYSDNNFPIKPSPYYDHVTIRSVRSADGPLSIHISAKTSESGKNPELKIKSITVLTGEVEKPVVTTVPSTINQPGGQVQVTVSDPSLKLYYTYLWEEDFGYESDEHGTVTEITDGLMPVYYGPTYYVWAEKDGMCSEPVPYRHWLQRNVTFSKDPDAIYKVNYGEVPSTAKLTITCEDLDDDEVILYSKNSDQFFSQTDEFEGNSMTFDLPTRIDESRGRYYAGPVYFHIYNPNKGMRSKVYKGFITWQYPSFKCDLTHTIQRPMSWAYAVNDRQASGPTQLRITMCNIENPTFHYEITDRETGHKRTGSFTDFNGGPIIDRASDIEVYVNNGSDRVSASQKVVFEDPVIKLITPSDRTITQSNYRVEFLAYPSSYLSLNTYYTLNGIDPENSDERELIGKEGALYPESLIVVKSDPGEYTVKVQSHWNGKWTDVATNDNKLIVGDHPDFGFKHHQFVTWAEDGETGVYATWEPNSYEVANKGEDDSFINRYHAYGGGRDYARDLSVNILYSDDNAVNKGSYYSGSPYFTLTGEQGEALIEAKAVFEDTEILGKLGVDCKRMTISSCQAVTVLGKYDREHHYTFKGAEAIKPIVLEWSDDCVKGDGSLTIPAGGTVTVKTASFWLYLRGLMFHTKDKKDAEALVTTDDGYSYTALVPMEGTWRKWMGKGWKVTYKATKPVTIYGVDVYYKRFDTKLTLTGDKNIVAVVGDEPATPTVVNPLELPLTFTSSMPGVCTVDADGKLTPKSAGESTIKVEFPGDDYYTPSSVEYSVYVKEVFKPAEIGFSFDDPSGLARAKARGGEKVNGTITTYYDASNQLTEVQFKGQGVSGNIHSNSSGEIGTYKGVAPFILASGAYLAFYGEGMVITRIFIEPYNEANLGTNNRFTVYNGDGEYNRKTGEWEGSSTSVWLRLDSPDFAIRRIVVYTDKAHITKTEDDDSYSELYDMKSYFDLTMQRPLKANQLTTFCSYADISAERLAAIDNGMEVYEYDWSTTDAIGFRLTDHINALEPYLVMPSKDIDAMELDDILIDERSFETITVGDYYNQVSMTGVLRPYDVAGYWNTFVFNEAACTIDRTVNTSDERTPELKGMRAYFHAPSDDVTTIRLDVGGYVVGVKDVETTKPATAATSGRDAYYSLSGQRIAKPAKGIFIKNGRKVVVK